MIATARCAARTTLMVIAPRSCRHVANATAASLPMVDGEGATGNNGYGDGSSMMGDINDNNNDVATGS